MAHLLRRYLPLHSEVVETFYCRPSAQEMDASQLEQYINIKQNRIAQGRLRPDTESWVVVRIIQSQ